MKEETNAVKVDVVSRAIEALKPLHDMEGRGHGLIYQLEQAVTPSGEASGGGTSAKSGAPLDVGVLDMLKDFDEELERFGIPKWSASTREGNVRALVQVLTLCGIGGMGEVEGWATGWVAKIQDFLNPERLTPLDAACPECRYKFFIQLNLEGEEMKKHCLHVRWQDDKVAGCICKYCGFEAPREELLSIIEWDGGIFLAA